MYKSRFPILEEKTKKKPDLGWSSAEGQTVEFVGRVLRLECPRLLHHLGTNTCGTTRFLKYICILGVDITTISF